MKVRFTRPALADLDGIVEYIRQNNPAAATQVEEAIRNAAALLGHFPQMGHLKYLPGVRMMPVRRYPYLIFYTIESDEVRILSVRHGARRPLTER
jgi:addiction module RelE/StbE family toxin